MMATFLPILAALTAAEPASQTCRLERSIGRVDEVIPVARRRGLGPVVTAPGGSPQRVRPDDLLCGGDVVVNPRESGVRVVLRIGSRVVPVEPGRTETVPDPYLRIPFPSLPEFIAAYRKYNADRESLREGVPRGVVAHPTVPGTTCALIPPAQSRADNLILREHPVYLSWTCGTSQARFTATITTGGSSRTLNLTQPALRLEPRRLCPGTCLVTLQDLSGVAFAQLRLSSVGIDALGKDTALLDTQDPRARALLASRLLDRRQWELTGASMLRDQACDFPPAAAAALDIYEARGMDELCVRSRP